MGLAFCEYTAYCCRGNRLNGGGLATLEMEVRGHGGKGHISRSECGIQITQDEQWEERKGTSYGSLTSFTTKSY